MKIDLKIPEVGESITEGTIVSWFKASGDLIAKDEPLYELETDKITMEVTAEVAGVLTIFVAGGDVEVGQVVGTIQTEGRAAASEDREAGDEAGPVKDADRRSDDGTERLVKVSAALGADGAGVQGRSGSEGGEAAIPVPPATRRMAAEEGVDLSQVVGTGKAGRIMKRDVMADVADRDAVEAPPPGQGRAQNSRAKSGGAEVLERETHRPMSSLRRRVAERLVEVQQNAAILTTFNEVDMSAVMAARLRYQDRFIARYGQKLGFMSFFVKAVVDALKAVPSVNARIEGDDIIENHYYDIGVAVGTDKGLVVPVVRDADRLGFGELEERISDFGLRARERRLELSEIIGGVFTISNGGVYGSLVSTPILNPPQSAILGMHAIKKRAVVVEDDRIEARPMMYLALSYDHRLIDGREAVTFLKHIVEILEDPQRLLFEI
ncbi:MAG: 2-oxoglutarate dehydrogenase complex dihydrolipoyllysine-residue succinyltransferase [Deltaproteobacteria bacterium]|nr:2-oxoglutarate dehydrogenase complex dihydrolipoyllysine-residue succinyltransferase [Deltaproteobacteria bacterium]